MSIGELLPFWGKLTAKEQEMLDKAAQVRNVKKGTVLHGGGEECVGLLLVISGRLRAYILSDEGKELTLYRLLERDMCLFSASCSMNSLQFDVAVEAEQDTAIWHIPPDVYKKLMEQSVVVAGYTNELMASRFSDVMWLMDQILNKKIDSRLAALLLEESALSGSEDLKITHEQLARHLGSAREVVTRMLKYFQNEHLVRLTRGGIELLDVARLAQLAGSSLR